MPRPEGQPDEEDNEGEQRTKGGEEHPRDGRKEGKTEQPKTE
jgi:hypothetical protein